VIDISSPDPASAEQTPINQYLVSVTRGGGPGSDVPTVRASVTLSSLFARFLTEGAEITLKHVALLDLM
jgi:hypothetical protein